MKKRSKVFLALALCVTLLFTSVTGVSAAAVAEETASTDNAFMEGFANVLNTAFNKVVDTLLDTIVKFFPKTVLIKDVSEYESENFMEGTKDFIDEPVEGAKWNLGYAQASIVPEDFDDVKYYKGGYDLNLKLTEMIDDLKVRVVTLNDGSDRGTTAIIAIDCLGLANSDVRLIRAALADYAEANNIVSINVSATHVHSGIDTQGIYTDLFTKIITNLAAAITKSDKLAPAIDNEFRQVIIDKSVECVKSAFESMTEGTLTYAKTNAAEYVRDRTAPDIMIEDLYRFMFTPDDGSMGTIISNYGVHPECIGFGTKVGTSDFVYYTEKIVNEGGYNFMFLQGAVGTYTEDMGASSDGLELDRVESTIRYGEELGYILLGMTMTEDERLATLVDEEREAVAIDNENYTPWYTRETVTEREVAPMLNVAHNEYLASVDNGVYELFGKLSLANNTMVTDAEDNYYAVTEVGYMELGDIKIILCPGETYAELLKGGENMADFPYAPAYEILGTEDVIVCDLVNDALGYIMPDSFFTYATIRYEDGGITIDSSWGLTSLGDRAASNIYGAIYELIEEVR
ncbi:MAG: hypothetical protein J6Q94_01690 [Clostridia bacterium]|nr:hypothetical protein [Clostridia bacterium]